MKCENCGKRDAVVDYTQVIDGNKLHLHLCDKCASEMKIGIDFMFDIDDVFATFFNGISTMPTTQKLDVVKCQNCGSAYKDFRDSGKLGCAECYETFGDELDSVLKRLHGNNRHVQGDRKKIDAKKHTPENEIEDLKLKLKECIQKEEYEEAAKLRDRIKELENKRGEK